MTPFQTAGGFQKAVMSQFVLWDGLPDAFDAEENRISSESDQFSKVFEGLLEEFVIRLVEVFGVSTTAQVGGEECVSGGGAAGKDRGGPEYAKNRSSLDVGTEETESVE